MHFIDKQRTKRLETVMGGSEFMDGITPEEANQGRTIELQADRARYAAEKALSDKRNAEQFEEALVRARAIIDRQLWCAIERLRNAGWPSGEIVEVARQPQHRTPKRVTPVHSTISVHLTAWIVHVDMYPHEVEYFLVPGHASLVCKKYESGVIAPVDILDDLLACQSITTLRELDYVLFHLASGLARVTLDIQQP